MTFQANGWDTEWPKEPGHYWIYVKWGSGDYRLRVLHVRKITNGFMYVTDGSFIYESECRGTVFFKPIAPAGELPIVEA